MEKKVKRLNLLLLLAAVLGNYASAHINPNTQTPVPRDVQQYHEHNKSEIADNSQQSLYLTMQPYIVSIEIRTAEAAYSNPGTSFGTGSILDKEKGIILTNAHVATPDGIIDHYDITLHDGSVCKANLIYFDPWHDFALLQTDPNNLKSIPKSLTTLRQGVQLGEPVLIIGKNENKHFSMQTGTVANPHETTEQLPGECFRISLNAQGGASGSPIINTKGQVIGLLYASNGTTSAFALPIDYALDALDAIIKGEKPKRFGTGAIFQLTTLEDLVRYDNLDLQTMTKYTQKFPNAFNRGITVKGVLAQSPAQTLLEAGDLILKVNNHDVGPSLYHLDKIINEESEPRKGVMVFEIIRHGKAKKIQVATYNLHDRSIRQIIQFGKAMFFEINDEIMQRTGAPRGVFISNLKPGGSFYDVLPALTSKTSYLKGLIALTHIEDKPINTLDDIKKIIPDLIKKVNFYIRIKNYGTELVYNNEFSFSQDTQIKYVSYYSSDGLPELYTLNADTQKWELSLIK